MKSEKSNKRPFLAFGIIALLVLVGIGTAHLAIYTEIGNVQSEKTDHSPGHSVKIARSTFITDFVEAEVVQSDSSEPIRFPKPEKDLPGLDSPTSKGLPLGDQIDACLSEVVSWNDLVNIGVIMHRLNPTDFDIWIIRKAGAFDWKGVLIVKHCAEGAGYSSRIIDDKVRLALSNIPMFRKYSLPITDSKGYFSLWDRYVLYGYRYAEELNWETSRWNKTSGFLALRSVRDWYERAFYRCNPDIPVAESQRGTRWHEAGRLMDCFFVFYKLGVQDALHYALQEWQWLNSKLWLGNHFGYAPEFPNWEYSGMAVFPTVARLHLDGTSLGNWSRVTIDLQCRYTSRSWGSPQWHEKYRVVEHHNPSNSERRLDGTLDAWILLHTFYPLFNSGNQTNMRNMLEGNGITQASVGLIESDLRLAGTNAFRSSSSSNCSDWATAEAALCFFLSGISTQEGSGLAIPLASDEYDSLNFRHFEFDAVDHRIKIPVWNGTILEFMYGNTPVTRYFGTTGIYDITFAPDWNSISNVTRVSDLYSNEVYLIPHQLAGPCAPPFLTPGIVALLILVGIALVYVLVSASALASFLGDTTEAIIIVAIMLINAILGFAQEYRLETAIDELRKYLSYTTAVLRDEKKGTIDTKELVPGDCLLSNWRCCSSRDQAAGGQ